jgi:cysteine desulfurase
MITVIYLDHDATATHLPEVLEAMMRYLTTEWSNPSAYKFGAKLKSVVETAREQVAELVGAHPLDVIFASCATESNNAAIAAALHNSVFGRGPRDRKNHGRRSDDLFLTGECCG